MQSEPPPSVGMRQAPCAWLPRLASCRRFPPPSIAGIDYLQALVERYTLHGNAVREAIDQADEAGDADTADLFTEISRDLDKDLWFLQAHLQD